MDSVIDLRQRGRLRAARSWPSWKRKGEKVDRDAFGHVKLDQVKVGDWFGKQFGKKIGADKTLVQKSGYFGRSAAANTGRSRPDPRHGACGGRTRPSPAFQASSAMTRSRATSCAPSSSRASRAASISTRQTPWFADMLRDIGQER